jgi:GNAT superfamily N-acetyltransferase
VILLARLGLDRSVQGTGLGGDLLKEALARCAGAADQIGGRAVLVHAKDAGAAAFYQRQGFMPLEQNPNHLFV